MDTEMMQNRYSCFKYKKRFYNCFVALKTRDMPFFLFEMKANPDMEVSGIL